ncbi:MAG TPA: PD-(D/E)XK nuclease family protein, partial [Methylococcaceae bacterium]|nr:PD-(D/E)XK nuclease family protein [Methylococcaceae bacterium]
MYLTCDPEPEPDVLTDGAILVTATRRLARALRQAHAARQRDAGLRCWETPAILPWDAWLDEVTRECLPAARLPTSAQELWLWERALADSGDDDGLLQVRLTAAKAREAWNLLHVWRLPLEALRGQATKETETWLRWAGHYRRLCAQHGWIDAARLPDEAARALTEEHVAGRALLLCGFDELTPQRQAFLQRWRELGGTVRELEAQAGRPAPLGTRRTYADTHAEIRAAAHWARRKLETNPDGHGTRATPEYESRSRHDRLPHPGPLPKGEGEQGCCEFHIDARVGIIVPAVGALRAELWRVFSEVFHPSSLLPPFPEPSARAFNLSLGEPLAAQPLVHAALDGLALLRGAAEFRVWSALLRSPYLGEADSERDARARLETKLRTRRAPELSLDEVVWSAQRFAATLALVQRLEALKELSATLPDRQTPHEWLATFEVALRALGWPGERTLDSRDYQAAQAWRNLSVDLAALAPLRPHLGLDEALAKLEELANDALFQPESPDAPVQILGPLEAGGLEFDYLWLLGLHEDIWPPAPEPNPFLPLALQRRHGLPRASAQRELDYARLLTERLLSSAPEVVVSHPLRDGERELAPSPLIAALPLSSTDDTPQEPFHLGPAPLSCVEDVQGPPLHAARGGAGLLKSQAACPFQAFARYRLRACDLETPAEGLDAAQRGNLVHRVLELLWRELASLEGLLAQSPEDLAAMAARAARQALNDAERDYPFLRRQARLLELESGRLARLALDWLEVERRRATP